MSEAQKAYLQKQQEKSVPIIEQFHKTLANLEKNGVDKIYVDHDFWDEFNISQAQYLCGLKQKFFFYFYSTYYNDGALLGSYNKGKKAIYCSRENLFIEPVYGNYRLGWDQNGQLTVYSSYNNATDNIKTNYNSIQAELWEKNKPKTNKEKAEAMSSIKKTCKDFGFKEGTEKFAECLKDIYLKDNTQNSQPIIVQQGDSGSKALADEMKAQRHQRTYDELLGLGQELSKGRSLGEIYGGAPPKLGGGVSCNLTNSVMSGTNRICYYRCGVSTQTSNVGAAQQCPLTM